MINISFLLPQAISWRISTPGPVEQFQFPLLDFSVLFLLRILDISAVLLAIASILTGKSVVVHSSQVGRLRTLFKVDA